MRSTAPRDWEEEEEEEEGFLALTSAEDYTLIGGLVLGFKAETVPALVPELMLALMDSDLDGGDHDIRTMASKKKEIILQVTVNNQELWEEMLGFKGLIVVDVYQGWCGPCRTVVNLFRKIRNELGDDLLHFAVAEVDSIDALENHRGKCEPTFLFYAGGELVAVVRGANAPLLQKTILDQLEAERKVLEQGAERVVVIRGLNI
ncbi:mediator of RNA polymerase II transcription subunit 12-like protein [Platysternon megacephalum]|uniref:Mediator of RNA polymerase II transcription subunit 12-like protein n=1 Tax=Platysternon megacephalum TaxID=55544 RepID=A0A4D9EF75_9SAUR|nr:mediator of RNA polymerase II transcription subunit 12-like protein [Platysternon megacephalum]